MASRKAVLAALTMLGRAFAGEVNKERVAVYAAAWDDLPDDVLARATGAVIRTYTGEFIPPPAVVRAACGADTVKLDVEAVARAVDRLGHHTPNGWALPSVGRVREVLGEAVAFACAEVGIHRLCSDDERTRDIALRDFQQALAEETRVYGVPAQATWVIRGAPSPKLLGPGE